MSFSMKFKTIVSALVFAACMMTYLPTSTFAAQTDDCNDDWLHAVGSKLYDKEGNQVWLTGANWFGFNCVGNTPYGLWSVDADELLSSVATRGINVIRFPVSTELLLSWMNGKPYSCPLLKADETVNPDFRRRDGSAMNSLEVFDVILKKCKKYGIKAFVDVHSPASNNGGHSYGLWYYEESFENAKSYATINEEQGNTGEIITWDDWIESLTWLAKKYANDDTLLAYDLKNEPHGVSSDYFNTCSSNVAKWDDSTDKNNWRYSATKCAQSILSVNPNALILIEGIEMYPKTEEGYTFDTPDIWDNVVDKETKLYETWWGANLRGVKEYPIDLGSTDWNAQIVYSPHDYGPSVYDQVWFQKEFDTQSLLDDYWYNTWAYINDKDIAPLLIGEWGGHMDGGKNQKWMELLRDYMIENHINHTFWCLNPESSDTGGLLLDDYVTWDEEKYALLEKGLWQTNTTGKYIGLDHVRPLGTENTGISLTEYYNSFAAYEGSNIDGGVSKSSGENPSDLKAAFDRSVDGNSFSHTSRPGGGFEGLANKQFHNQKYITAFCNRFGCPEWRLNQYCDEDWHGSCHGIAYTIALQYNRQIDITKLSKKNAKCYYEMEKPIENDEFMDTINYYQIKQKVTDSDLIARYYKSNWLSDLVNGESISKTLETIVQSIQAKDERDTYVFGFGYQKRNNKGELVPSGHAIVAIDVKLNQSTDCYWLKLFDENGKMVTMNISSDYKRFCFIDANGNKIGNWNSEYDYTYIELIRPDVSNLPNAANINKVYYAAPSISTSVSTLAEADAQPLILEFPMDSEFLLTNQEGEYLRYQGEETETTMSIINGRIISDTDKCDVHLEIPYSDSFTLENLGDKISMMISNNKAHLSLNDAEVSGADFDLDKNNLHITDAKGAFTVYLPPKENDGALVRFSGNATGTVDVSASAGEIQLSGDTLTDVTAKAITAEQTKSYYLNDGNIVNATFSDDRELVSDMLHPFGDEMPGTAYSLGDVTGDGVINAKDAAEVLIAAAKIGTGKESGLTAEKETAADVNADGTINAKDANTILRYASAVGTGAKAKIADFV